MFGYFMVIIFRRNFRNTLAISTTFGTFVPHIDYVIWWLLVDKVSDVEI
jgi:hypothetical protein